MYKWYLIEYTADTGYEYIRDVALIKANNEQEAKELLRKHIIRFGNDYGIGSIFKIKEFKGNVFTGSYGTDINE